MWTERGRGRGKGKNRVYLILKPKFNKCICIMHYALCIMLGFVLRSIKQASTSAIVIYMAWCHFRCTCTVNNVCTMLNEMGINEWINVSVLAHRTMQHIYISGSELGTAWFYFYLSEWKSEIRYHRHLPSQT